MGEGLMAALSGGGRFGLARWLGGLGVLGSVQWRKEGQEAGGWKNKQEQEVGDRTYFGDVRSTNTPHQPKIPYHKSVRWLLACYSYMFF